MLVKVSYNCRNVRLQWEISSSRSRCIQGCHLIKQILKNDYLYATGVVFYHKNSMKRYEPSVSHQRNNK